MTAHSEQRQTNPHEYHYQLGSQYQDLLNLVDRAGSPSDIFDLLPTADRFAQSFVEYQKIPEVDRPRGTVKAKVSGLFLEGITLEFVKKRNLLAERLAGYQEFVAYFGREHASPILWEVVNIRSTNKEDLVRAFPEIDNEALTKLNSDLYSAYNETGSLLSFLERENPSNFRTEPNRDKKEFNYKRAHRNIGYLYQIDEQIITWFEHHVGHGSERVVFHQYNDDRVTRIGLTGTFQKADGTVHSCPARSVHLTPFFHQFAHMVMSYSPVIDKMITICDQPNS